MLRRVKPGKHSERFLYVARVLFAAVHTVWITLQWRDSNEDSPLPDTGKCKGRSTVQIHSAYCAVRVANAPTELHCGWHWSRLSGPQSPDVLASAGVGNFLIAFSPWKRIKATPARCCPFVWSIVGECFRGIPEFTHFALESYKLEVKSLH